MKSIRDMWLIEIDITNACHNQCANCTRFIGHHRKLFFMDLATFEQAVDSLEGFSGRIGIIGGEPTLHPQFKQICLLMQKKVPFQKRLLLTSGYKWEEYKHLIRRVFGDNVFYNDHTGLGQRHQPVLIAIEEVVEDKNLMWELIDRCWLQDKWSGSITPRGCFFCEVAAALDTLFDGPGGFPIARGWWDKTPEQFRAQKERYCPRCSIALPLPPFGRDLCDIVSPGNLVMLKNVKSPRASDSKNVVIFDKKLTRSEIDEFSKEWCPWNYLGPDGKRASRPLYGLVGLRQNNTFCGKALYFFITRIRKMLGKREYIG